VTLQNPESFLDTNSVCYSSNRVQTKAQLEEVWTNMSLPIKPSLTLNLSLLE